MHISRVILNMRHSRARRDVAVPYDLHRTLVTQVFGDRERAGRLLFRIEPERESRAHGGPVVLLQSAGALPDWSRLDDGYVIGVDGPRPFQPAIEAGQLLGFRLLANPVERQRQHDGDGNVLRGSGTRPHVRFSRRGLLHPEEQEEWLQRQGATRIRREDGLLVGGFRLRYVTLTPQAMARRRSEPVAHNRKVSLPHVGVRFDGVLEVTDAAAFLTTLACGIGPAKAFGFGYLSIAPLRA